MGTMNILAAHLNTSRATEMYPTYVCQFQNGKVHFCSSTGVQMSSQNIHSIFGPSYLFKGLGVYHLLCIYVYVCVCLRVCLLLSPHPPPVFPIQYNTIQYNTIQYNTIQYNTIQCNTIQYNTKQCNTIQYNIIQYNTIQYNTIQYNTIQCNTIQYNTPC